MPAVRQTPRRKASASSKVATTASSGKVTKTRDSRKTALLSPKIFYKQSDNSHGEFSDLALTPGWKAAESGLFQTPQTPSPFKNRRMTRRSSMYIKVVGSVTSLGEANVEFKKPKLPSASAAISPAPKKKTPVTRSRRRTSVYVKKGSRVIDEEPEGASGAAPKLPEKKTKSPASTKASPLKSTKKRTPSPKKTTRKSSPRSRKSTPKETAAKKRRTPKKKSPSARRSKSPRKAKTPSPRKAKTPSPRKTKAAKDEGSAKRSQRKATPPQTKSQAKKRAKDAEASVDKTPKMQKEADDLSAELSLGNMSDSTGSQKTVSGKKAIPGSIRKSVAKVNKTQKRKSMEAGDGASPPKKSTPSAPKKVQVVGSSVTKAPLQRKGTPIVPRAVKKVAQDTPVLKESPKVQVTQKSAKVLKQKTPEKAAKVLGKTSQSTPKPRTDKVIKQRELLTSTPLKSAKKRVADMPPPVSEIRQSKRLKQQLNMETSSVLEVESNSTPVVQEVSVVEEEGSWMQWGWCTIL